ncbi:MAG: hypothetical protein ACREOI_00740 [bacterium]
MKNSRFALFGILIICVLALGASPLPDVKTISTTKLTFKGTLGTMMKMFGGNKPVTSTQYIQGNKSRTDNVNEEGKLTTSTIVDLDREAFINIDHKKKEYTEMTFDYYRNMLKSMGGKSEEKQEHEKSEPEVKVSFDVKVDKTGEKKNIAGYYAEKVILTMTAKGEKQAEGGPAGEMEKGGMIITSTNWLSTEVKGYDEVIAFHKAFAEKLGMKPGGSWAGMIEKSSPQLAEAMKKLEEEGKKFQGVPLSTESVFETWAQPSEAQAGTSETMPEEQEKPKSVGGLLGGFGKKLGQKAMKKDDNADNSGRNVLMESVTEISEISNTSLNSGLFAVPTDYKKKEVKN